MLRWSAGAIASVLAALFFTTLLVAVFRIEYIPLGIALAVWLVVALALLAPGVALPFLAVFPPIAAFVVSRYANRAVAWAEVAVVAGLIGFHVRAITPFGRARRLDPALAVPVIVFGTLVVASMVASLGVLRLRLGPVFADVVWAYLTRNHFFDVRSFPALHAGILLLEGLLLFAVAARECEAEPRLLSRVTTATALGAALSAAINISAIARPAARTGDFWAALAHYAASLRWTVQFGDVNAAGSYFLMGLLLAAGAAAAATGIRRAMWTAVAALVFAAFWLTGSRAALLAGILSVAGAFALTQIGRAGTVRLRRAAALAVVACLLGVGLTMALPYRGTQKSTLIAADVRVGLAQTSARMIAERPVFGIGLGEFYQRSGEFSSAELIQLFPPVVHENAHNNFLQIAAELGLAGGLAFAWLIVEVLALAARGAARSRSAPTTLTAAAVAGFIITWLGGHPLLVAEVAFAFWILAGAVAGEMTAEHGPLPAMSRWRSVVGIALVIVAVTLPWRMRAMLRDAELEHVGIGVTGWTAADDTERYRTAIDQATLFVPAGTGFAFRVKPMTDRPIALELRLDGRVADVVTLVPNEWNDVRIPRRTERAESRFVRLDLRLDVPAERPVTMRITKVMPTS